MEQRQEHQMNLGLELEQHTVAVSIPISPFKTNGLRDTIWVGLLKASKNPGTEFDIDTAQIETSSEDKGRFKFKTPAGTTIWGTVDIKAAADKMADTFLAKTIIKPSNPEDPQYEDLVLYFSTVFLIPPSELDGRPNPDDEASNEWYDEL